jgi:acyl-coenzyme A synthetase/AMP-(fatty) acid ligase
MHPVDMIFFWAKAKPHHPAIIQSDMVVTYKGLAEAIEAISFRIARYEFDPHEPVAILIESAAKLLAVTFALLKTGLIAAPVYRGLLPFLRGAGIKHLISTGAGQVLSGGRNIRFDDTWLQNVSIPSGAKVQGRSGASYPDVIFFTSGTTGMPKKYIQSCEGFLERMRTAVLRESDETSRTLILPGAPSSFGFNHACEMLHAGKTACFTSLDENVLAFIGAYRVDAIVASPQQILTLVNLVEKGAGQFQLDSLKSIRLGGGLISKTLARRIKASLCPHMTIIYGSTEAGNMAFANYDAIANIPDAVGFVPPWVQMEIVDDSGAVLPPETEGYIRCRTPIFAKHFAANNPDAKADAREAWWHPGDLGRLTRNGMLCVSGRGGDVINCGGNKVSAAVLEEALLSLAGIKDAGICGVMGDSGINEVWIGVVPETEIEILKLRQQIERKQEFNAPVDEIFVVTKIPRNELGKIKRRELQEMLLSLKKPSVSP